MKRCSRCKQQKPESEFSPIGRGYLDSRCKPCNNERVKARYAAHAEQERQRDRETYWRDPEAGRERKNRAYRMNPGRVIDCSKRQYAANRRDAIARAMLGNAVKLGRIARPTTCSRCGGCGQRIEAHHHDYEKPYDVTWLCSACHGLTRRK